jgi:hypothetical protein
MPDPSTLVERLRPLRAPASDGTEEVLIATLIGCAAGLALAFAVFFRLAQRRPLRRAAIDALVASRALPAPERLAAQARILRRLASALDPPAAQLHGEEWLARLDAMFATTLFSEGPGRAFGDALYRPRDDDPTEALDRALERLLAKVER